MRLQSKLEIKFEYEILQHTPSNDKTNRRICAGSNAERGKVSGMKVVGNKKEDSALLHQQALFESRKIRLTDILHLQQRWKVMWEFLVPSCQP